MSPIVRLACLTFLLAAPPAVAQTGPGTPRVALELTTGYAGFVDDATIDHAVIGAALVVVTTQFELRREGLP